MLYHHDNRDYQTAATAAASNARQKLDDIIQKGKTNAQEVIRRVMEEVPNDRILRGRDIHFVPTMIDDNGERFEVQAILEDEGQFRLHKNAFAQVRERLHIPGDMAAYLNGEGPWGVEKLGKLMTDIAHHENARYLTREVNGEVRGWLSDQYRRLDSRPLLGAFAEAAGTAGLVPIEGYALDTKIAFKAIYPEVFEPLPNEVMAFGLKWGNSDYGNGKHNLHAFVLRLWCTNYAIAEDVLSQVHLGGRLPDDLRLSETTYQLDTQTSASAMRDIVGKILSPQNIAGYLEAIKESHEKSVNKSGAFESLQKKLPKKDVEAIKNAFESPDTYNLPAGDTMWRLSNAVSWIANATTDREKALDMMKIAGDIAKLPKLGAAEKR